MTPPAPGPHEARTAKQQADTEVADTRSAFGALQPDLLEADRDRLQRAWNETERQRQAASTARAVSEAALRSDGTTDPSAALAQAQARLAAANAHLAAVRRKAQAIALVNRLFQDEQRALADRFSQPLAHKISGYLQSLFGADAEAVVRFEDNRLQGIQLVRSARGAAEPFDVLSGGTREQVAAAVRLAIAELLSADQATPCQWYSTMPLPTPIRSAFKPCSACSIWARRGGCKSSCCPANPSDYPRTSGRASGPVARGCGQGAVLATLMFSRTIVAGGTFPAGAEPVRSHSAAQIFNGYPALHAVAWQSRSRSRSIIRTDFSSFRLT